MDNLAVKFKDIAASIGSLGRISEGWDQELLIRGLAYDSRLVREGYIFAALKGVAVDGHKFIPQALEKGAKAVITEVYQEDLPASIPQIVTDDSRILMSHLAGILTGHPDRDLYMVGITGTNGKTTTTYLIKWLWECFGKKAGLIGTINNYVGQEKLDAHHTTPESLELFNLLSKMKDSGCSDVVLEVSSHSLKQGRVAGCKFDAAIFSNLTQDHLDYHLTLEDYKACKAKLFELLKENKESFAIINRDDEASSYMAEHCPAPVYYYGMSELCHLRAQKYIYTPSGMEFSLSYGGNEYQVKIPLLGKFNIYNTLAALGVVLKQGYDIEKCVSYLAEVPQVPGRFELIDEGQDFTVVVDYAHTPDGLLNLLSSAKEIARKRVITLFGCGGDRDKTKRPIMADIASRFSDFIILTSDNPRTEDPFEILDQIETGLKNKPCPYLKIENRRQAIAAALGKASVGDLVLIAGKGHEDYQLVKGEILRFDDRETARELLKNRGN